MHASTFLLLAAFTAAAEPQVLDDFRYEDDPQVRAAWISGERSPPVRVATVEGSTVLELPAPFAADPSLPRAVIDRRVNLDLTVPSRFTLEIRPSDVSAGENVSLYFRSGGGWYGGSAGLGGSGWRTLTYSKDSFRPEGQPAGWNHVDGIRIAVWRGATARDTSFFVRRLTAEYSETAIVISAGSGGEFRTAREVAERLSDMLEELGVTTDTLPESAVRAGALGDRPLVILPYNPELDPATCDALVQFVEQGGRLLTCYTLPPQLEEALGVRRGEFVRSDPADPLASMRFPESNILGLPAVVRQASWNIQVAKPFAHGARAIGQWYTASEKATGWPAVVLSERGAFVSHIVLADDWEGKRNLLAAVLGSLHPPLWSAAAAAAIERADRIGHCQTHEELLAAVRNQLDDETRKAWQQADEDLLRARQLVADGQSYLAAQAAANSRRLRREVYLRAQPSPAREGRAFWNHSGTGAYPGDWDRTARELSAAGFNMILPNMLWGGLAHYPSDMLPRSETFRKYGDQIAQCVAAAKKHGLEVHVWKVNFNLSGAPREFVEQMRREGRTQVDVDGKPSDWLNPAHPANQQLELESLLEVIRKYAVDGIHFDYIRYPGDDNCYSDYSRERFEQDTGRKVEHWPVDCHSGPLQEAYRDWRCEQITRLVAAVHREARRIRPDVKISAAVFNSYPSCRKWVGQDWPLWIREGYLDFVCPMNYTESDAAFTDLIRAQQQLVAGRIPIYPGIGATASRMALSSDRVVGQIHITRELGTGGFTVFNLSESTAASILPALASGAGRTKAVPPHNRD